MVIKQECIKEIYILIYYFDFRVVYALEENLFNIF